MSYDIIHVPFSHRGSYLSISSLNSRQGVEAGIYLRSLRNGDETPYHGAVMRLELISDGTVVKSVDARVTPATLKISKSTDEFVTACFESNDVIRFKCHTVSVRFTVITEGYDYAVARGSHLIDINSYTQQTQLRITAESGYVSHIADWDTDHSTSITIEVHPEEGSQAEFTITNYATVPFATEQDKTFEECIQIADHEFKNWLTKTLPVPVEFSEARELAAYITWSCVVDPDGLLSRPTMYMSKNSMTNVWSWDHCFNAMALTKTNPELAWDQLMVIFDHQDVSGQLPDFVNNRYCLWNCCKPPVHGWTLRWMMQRTKFISRAQLSEIYEPLQRWTRWWLMYRDDNKNGIPQYNHGNESGWDNATLFAQGVPIESPDLATFMIIQMDVLSSIALKLNRPDESEYWSTESDKMLKLLLSNLWNEGAFRANRLYYRDGKLRETTVTSGDSLVLFVPLLLGDKLPENVRSLLVSGLNAPNRFLTAFGLSTESISSDLYHPDGYWRGPIWAPTTMLIVDALKQIGEYGLSRDIARRFCQLVSTSGMAENFDAVTGVPLRDKAFTWTSSVFLILANEYL